jgi:hypothetical protein
LSSQPQAPEISGDFNNERHIEDPLNNRAVLVKSEAENEEKAADIEPRVTTVGIKSEQPDDISNEDSLHQIVDIKPEQLNH